MWTVIRVTGYLRMRLLRNYGAEKPGQVIPSLALLALVLALNLIFGAGRVAAPLDTQTAIQSEVFIHLLLTTRNEQSRGSA
ncbi:MAG: hypothetical protein FJY97_08330 [candidate division Zixibacteria bacterium]|nr:hypothetical protein [candidate division Zixibacteria bacterium]